MEHFKTYAQLPAGLVIVRSWGRVDLGEDGGPLAGAYLRNADSTEWYGADWTGSMADPTPYTSAAYWGPMPSLAAAKAQMPMQVTTLIDSDGTDGSSDWFVAPE